MKRPPYWTLAALALAFVVPGMMAVIAAAAAIAVVATVVRAVRAARPAPELAPPPTSVRLGHRVADSRPLVLGQEQLAAHGLIVGATGSGKTTTLLRILDEQIRAGAPVVAIDMKGSPEFAATLAAGCAAAERRLRIWRPEGPERWNPLAYGNATELKDKLIASERFTEPHYQRQAERFLQLALGVLLDRHPQQQPTLRQVVAALEPQRLAALAGELGEERAAPIHDYLASLGRDGISAARGMATRLAILSESFAGPFLEPHSGAGAIDVRRALDGEEVVLFSLNSSRIGALAAQLGTLVIQDVSVASGHRLGGADQQPLAIVAIDEFSALGSDNLLGLVARGRGSRLGVLIATQELADLDRAGPGFRDQVVGNATLKIAHRQDVPASARMIAQMAGTEMVWEQTERFGTGLARWQAQSVSRRQVERFVVHPDAVARLRTGEALVIRRVPETDVSLVRVTPPQSRASVPPAVRAEPSPISATPRVDSELTLAPSRARPRAVEIDGRGAARRPPVPRGRDNRGRER